MNSTLARDTPIHDLPISTRSKRAIINYLMAHHGQGPRPTLAALEDLTAYDLRYLIPDFGPVSFAEVVAFLRDPARGIVVVEGVN